MAIWVAIILGVVQGLAEFLPISSSGHLMLLEHFFGINAEGLLLFNIFLHIATLLAVVFVFRKKIWALIKKPLQPFVFALVIATIITCGFVLIFKDLIDSLITIKVLPFMFMLTAVLLFLTTMIKPRENPKSVWVASGVVGLMQGIAVVPGLSRSGWTVAGSLFSGMSREDAAEFSFLLSIPIILASLVYELIGGSGEFSFEVLPMTVAFIIAFLVGIFSIKFMLKIIKKVKLGWFSLYLVVLSFALLFLL